MSLEVFLARFFFPHFSIVASMWIPQRCKGVHCVDLGESFPTHTYLQNLVSIQPRTSPLKFAAPRPRPPTHLEVRCHGSQIPPRALVLQRGGQKSAAGCAARANITIENTSSTSLSLQSRFFTELRADARPPANTKTVAGAELLGNLVSPYNPPMLAVTRSKQEKF